jgi:hypothetical protein
MDSPKSQPTQVQTKLLDKSQQHSTNSNMTRLSGLPPQEAPVMITEKRKLFFSFLFLR